jgi:hypothetical protein
MGRSAPNSTLRYPSDPDKPWAPLTGPPGTEMVLVCGKASGAPNLEEVNAAWGPLGKWVSLPATSILRLHNREVTAESGFRGVGSPVDVPDPEGQVMRRMEDLGDSLSKQFEYIEAVAFAHVK